MGNRYRKPPPNAVNAIGKNIKDIAKLSRTPRSVATTVDRGNWVFKDRNTGQIIVKFGDSIINPGNTVWDFWRGNNGRLALSINGLVNQFVEIRDNVGNIVFSDDASSEQGLATPYLNIPMGLSFNANNVPLMPFTVSGSFESLWECSPPLTHPRISILALVSNNDSTSTGGARITISGNQVGSTVSVGAGGTFVDQVVDIPDWGVTTGYLAELSLRLECRRLTGSGHIVAVIYSCYGKQS